MSFQNPNVIKGAIADLREILSSSQGDAKESLKLINQLEATVYELERKCNDANFVAPPTTTPVVI